MSKQTIADKKFHKVMREFSSGKLKSSSGEKVVDKQQALAIAFSEARSKDKKYKLQRFENGVKIKADTTLQLVFEDAWQKYLDYIASSKGKPKSFAEWLRTDENGLKYNKRMAQIIRDETKINDEPILNERGTKISNNEQHGGGKLSGNYHTDGGIRAIIKETGKPVEVENEELITTRGVSQSEDFVTCTGKPEAIVSDLNVKYGGDKISDKSGQCSIIKKHIMEKGAKVFYKQRQDGDLFPAKIIKTKKNQYEIELTQSKLGFKKGDIIIVDKSDVVFKNKKMKAGSKIKSHLNESKIQRMIIRSNELKRADNGIKIVDEDSEQHKKIQMENEFILVTEPEVFAVMEFLEYGKPMEYEKATHKFNWRGNDICIYKYNEDLVKFLNKYGIHYKVFESKEELKEFLVKTFVREHRAKQLGIKQ